MKVSPPQPSDRMLMYLHILRPLTIPSNTTDRLNASHHFLLGDQMVDALQQAEQALHTPAPLVQHLIRISRLGETNQSRRAVDLGVDRFGRDELADVGLGLVLVEVEQLRQTTHLDPGVVFGHHAHVVFDDPLSEILPARVRFRVVVGRNGGCGGEDVGGAEVWTEFFGDDGPAHEFGDGEEFEKLGFQGDEAVAGIGMYAMEKIRLLVVVGR